MSPIDVHNTAVGGHELVDVDPYLPTGVCAVCEGMALDERPPENRGPDNPYDSGVPPEELPVDKSSPESIGD